MQPRAEIIAIGNELLLGDVLDSNSHWLCGQLTEMGFFIQRVTQLPDERDVIAEALRVAKDRGSNLIITVGGLGPTEDDLTLAAVAQAVDVALQRNGQAWFWVRDTYRDLEKQGAVTSAEMTDARTKMAQLPARAEPLVNNEGAAPGVWLEWSEIVVISLPGVPREMRAIYEDDVRGRLVDLFGEGQRVRHALRVDCGDESVLAPVLSHVRSRHPEAYVKSRARRFGADVRFQVIISAPNAAVVQGTEQTLRRQLGALGIDVIREKLAGEAHD